MKDLALRIEAQILAGKRTTADIAACVDRSRRIVAVTLCRLAREGRVERSGYGRQSDSNIPVILWSVVGRVRELEGAK